MSPSLRHLRRTQQHVSFKRPLRHLCTSSVAAPSATSTPTAVGGIEKQATAAAATTNAVRQLHTRSKIVSNNSSTSSVRTNVVSARDQHQHQPHPRSASPSVGSGQCFSLGRGGTAPLSDEGAPSDIHSSTATPSATAHGEALRSPPPSQCSFSPHTVRNKPLFFSTADVLSAADTGGPSRQSLSVGEGPAASSPATTATTEVLRSLRKDRSPSCGDTDSGRRKGDRYVDSSQMAREGFQQTRRVFSSVPADTMISQQQQQQPQQHVHSEVEEELLQSLADKEATPLSLRDIHAFCRSSSPSSRLMQAQFLYREIPIRFAKRVLELRDLPYGLSDTAPVVEAAGWYARVMRQVVQHPWPDGQEGEEDFAVFLSSLLMDHAAVPQPLSRGVLELPERGEVGLIQRHRIDRILDNFFISRISLRFLVDTYVSSKQNQSGYSGVIQSECSPVLVAWKAAADVDRLCRAHMGTAPAIEVFGREQDTLTAVPSFLYYILREVLKNSCRATVDHGHLTRPGEKLPPVKVIVARGKEDITIKIVDEGGGIRRSELQHVWSYMYSSAPKPTEAHLNGVPLDNMSGMRLKEEEAPLMDNSEPGAENTFAFAGYGMGLPLSRLYARYFGGSLKLRPLEGYGTDTYIHLHRLKTNSSELLPDSLEKTLRVMADDGRVKVSATRSWKTPPKNDNAARELIRSLGEGL